MSKKPQNLINRRFGRLIVLHNEKNENNKTVWICKCDCGNIRKVMPSALLRKDGHNTRSCGCLHKDNTRKANTKKFGEASFNSLYCTYRNKARNKNIEFTLTKQEFKQQTKKVCYYCGIRPFQIAKRGNASTPYKYNGLDRLNNKLGYIISNVVPCCGICNRAKGALTFDEFKLWSKRLFHNLIG